MSSHQNPTRLLVVADASRVDALMRELDDGDDSFEVMVVTMISDALRITAQAPPDVVLLHASESALGTLRRAIDLPIVVVASTDSSTIAARAIANGATDAVVLGGRPSYLAWRLRLAIDRHLFERRLREAKTDAESASVRKTEFLSSMSHEIRTPLNTVLGMAELLGETTLSEKQQRYVTTLQRAGDHVLALVDDILDLARIEAGHLAINDVAFDLYEVAESAIEVVRDQARRKKLAIGSDLDAPRVVRGDPRRVRQVLVNLLSNAVKFTARGRVWMTLRRDASTDDSIATLRFEVSDTGIGIPQDRIDAIFDGFVQGDGSIEPQYGGFGLGLDISKRIVERMGGRIWAESREGDGASFFVTLALPIAHGAASPSFADVKTSSTDVHLKTLSGERLRVLVVDDSEDNRVVLGEYLRGADADVEFADDGASAIEKARAQSFDVVLMDLQMPHMDGYETTRELHRMWRATSAKAPPVIALSAHTLADSFARSIDAGCASQLTKPIRKRVLIEAVAHAGSAIVSERRERSIVAEDLEPLLPRFFANRRKDVRAIRDAVERNDFAMVVTIAHNMRGTGGSYGFPELGVIGEKLESVAKRGARRELELVVRDLEALVARLGAKYVVEPASEEVRRGSGTRVRAQVADIADAQRKRQPG